MENSLFELQYALDTFYFLVCGALVMWMAAGFSMLEAGLVRAKNTTEILTKNISLYAIACVMYLMVGYALMYDGGWFLQGIMDDGTENAAYYAPSADFFFQVVFVATAMSIVSGAVAERMKLWAFLAFAAVMTGFIYPIEGAWTWGGKAVFGLYSLSDFGFVDFAGSGIVHLAGATAALTGVLILGPRLGKYRADGSVNALPGANLPMATLGTFILWMGWFGFNGGSVLKVADVNSANSVALVFLNTNAAAAAGALAALALAKLRFGKADLTMVLNGSLAGLVAITASPDTPTPFVATLIGAIAGTIVVFSIVALDRLKIDDPVGAISVHGVAGVFGLMVVPFTHPAVYEGGALVSGSLFSGQLLGAVTVFLWVGVTSGALWWLLDRVMGIRVTADEERQGIDASECGLDAYPEFKSGKTA
jgi:Amt family ammonium transporter